MAYDSIQKILNYIKKNIHEIKSVVIRASDKEVLLDINGFVTDDFFLEFEFVDTIIYNNEVVKGNGYLEYYIDNKRFIVTVFIS